MTTTAQAFDKFVDQISPTPEQTTAVKGKRTTTENHLRGAFPSSNATPLQRVVLIGSAARGTLTRPIDDIDVMAQFTNKDRIFEQYRADSGAFLQRIRRALDAKTSIADIGARGQAVRLFYKSGAHVDIAPTFKWSGEGFALPGGSWGWTTTDPEAQAAWMVERRKQLGSHLTTVVKMAKRWNRVHSSRLSSFHVEVMTATMFSSLNGNLRDAMRCWFDWAPKYLDVDDPAGHGGNLGGNLTSTSRVALRERLGNAETRASLAIAHEEAGSHTDAKRIWKYEFGDQFPAS